MQDNRSPRQFQDLVSLSAIEQVKSLGYQLYGKLRRSHTSWKLCGKPSWKSSRRDTRWKLYEKPSSLCAVESHTGNQGQVVGTPVESHSGNHLDQVQVVGTSVESHTGIHIKFKLLEVIRKSSMKTPCRPCTKRQVFWEFFFKQCRSSTSTLCLGGLNVAFSTANAMK